jgi:predicted amino acid racemase
MTDLTPCDSRIRLIGASSDHLIVDLTQVSLQPGDIVEFTLSYPGLLRLMTSKYVKKIYRTQ